MVDEDDATTFGRLLASSARCETQQAATTAKLGHVEKQLQELLLREQAARGGVLAVRAIGGVVLTGLLSIASWLLYSHIQHGDRLAADEIRITRTENDAELLGRHNEEIRREISAMGADVRGLQTSINGLSQQEQDSRRELMEAVRRRR